MINSETKKTLSADCFEIFFFFKKHLNCVGSLFDWANKASCSLLGPELEV